MSKVLDDSLLRNRRYVFKDRAEAGRALATTLKTEIEGDAILLAIPSGGIPIAVSISKQLSWPIDIVIVRKLQIPFEPEAGFGAITMSGEMILNRELVSDLGLTMEEIEAARTKALEGGRSSEKALRIGLRHLPLRGEKAILVDDGLASGFTILAAIGEVKRERPKRTIVAVPTGSEHAIRMIASQLPMNKFGGL